jgi:hypothetical protein
MQCLPVPLGFKPAALAANMPVVTSFAAALNTQATCTQYVRPGGQCGGSAGACYGAQCAVRNPCLLLCLEGSLFPGMASDCYLLESLLATGGVWCKMGRALTDLCAPERLAAGRTGHCDVLNVPRCPSVSLKLP